MAKLNAFVCYRSKCELVKLPDLSEDQMRAVTQLILESRHTGWKKIHSDKYAAIVAGQGSFDL